MARMIKRATSLRIFIVRPASNFMLTDTAAQISVRPKRTSNYFDVKSDGRGTVVRL